MCLIFILEIPHPYCLANKSFMMFTQYIIHIHHCYFANDLRFRLMLIYENDQITKEKYFGIPPVLFNFRISQYLCNLISGNNKLLCNSVIEISIYTDSNVHIVSIIIYSK